MKITMVKSNFGRYVTMVLLFTCIIGCTSDISIDKVKEFIPSSVVPSKTHLFTGDLNNDGIEDAILRFKLNNDPVENEHFYIILGKSDNTLKIVEKDIFRFDNKNELFFDKVIISKNGDFSVVYCGKENTSGSYRKITFKYHSDKKDNDYWILSRDEELFQHKNFAPAPQEPIVVTQGEMRGIGGEYFGNIKEDLYDVMLRMKIKSQIPDSTSKCEAFSGDLNRDQYEDIILRYKLENEPDYREHFHLFLGQNNGTYKLASKNDILELDNVDGTVFDKIVIKNGYFSLEYRGFGNTSGSYEIITFKYSNQDENWFLHRVGSKYTHRYFTEGEPTENITTQKDFGKILFEEYGN